ncbi:tartrate transporter [Pseudomonas sp. Ag1]|uniref:MFS transporter n=1 Tax=Pseudomonas sp. Ag1 TaxID=1197727 RepID=UPI000272C8B6|nr:MFS transporter [Pseudomonas sp. Ag1]EJF69772.1 tartrate transporter [Pseudomonas sp. Ag1]
MSPELAPVTVKKIIRKVMLRIIPLTFFLYFVAFLDRVNLGYAALQMNADLALTSEAFGFAAGIFFIGNVLFEVPSNMLVIKFGPRVWIARIILTWGVVATLTAFVQTANQLYVLRFLLGVAEAGFLPGMVFYFALWFREKERATATGLFLLAAPVTYLVGAPLSTALMHYVTLGDIAGWRWMLFLEGLPAIVGGVLCYRYLLDSPQKATWLTQSEKDWLAAEFEREKASQPPVTHLGTWQALTNPIILYLSVIYFLSQVGALGIGYWLPQIVQNLSAAFSLTQIGLIAGLPYAAAGVGLVIWARLSDRFYERKFFTAIPLLLGAIGLFVAGTTQDPYLGMAAITLALTGIFATKSPFFAMLTQLFSKPTVAVAAAIISSLGNCGGFVGPYIVGVVKKATGTSSAGLFVLSGALLLAALMTLFIVVPRHKSKQASLQALKMKEQ